MFLELGLSIYHAWKFSNAFFIALAAIVIAIWAVTFFISVPCHASLGNVFTEQAYTKLCSTNWLRTALWTLEVVLVGCYLFKKL